MKGNEKWLYCLISEQQRSFISEPMTQTVMLECSNGKKLKVNHNDCSSAMIGKAQKFSKGYSSGFVPDYRHAIETVGESKGFGSSCRADSEDSCMPKRKCININADLRNSFNVPIQVISASKMSGLERKDLEMRLRGELEKVRILQKKIIFRIPPVSSGLTLSSSSDVHAKKHQVLKRGISGRFESMKQAPPPSGNSVSMVLKQCESLLKNLMQHKYSYVFKAPVDTVKLKIPDYFYIIKHPMDLGTVRRKLASSSYSSPLEFASDVRLTFTNAMTYNPPGNDVHIMADTLNKIFEKKWKPIGEKLAAVEEVVKRDKEATKTEPPPLQKKRKGPPLGTEVIMSNSVKPKMQYDEKQQIRNRLLSNIDRLTDSIVNFLKQQSHSANASDDEIEIDIESLDDDTLFELRRRLDEHFGVEQSVPQAKVEPCRMEMLVESGVSNSSMHPSRVNEPADEDVDIGGDDPPLTSYSPVEIEKDTAPGNSKCISSSSSSSDSGTSSSDSDSGSSSGSEYDVQAATPGESVKDNGQSGVARGLEKCDTAVSVYAYRTISGMDQQEPSAHLEPISVDADDCQEGENATSVSLVSPDKLYRAALLRSRFADTILKAREKIRNQVEKKDPEKLRREREELERQQWEERARLQAEARAVEDARRQAEAEAAAEVMRKRELEREAARQALLKVEKTVEINDNSLFVNDFEILGTVPGEHMQSTVHEMSLDHLQGFGGFNLGGSAPLEQLGLFRKRDEEEDEECEPARLPEDDIEEGEID